ncbi:MAG: SPOR domain-containing protein [Pseudomonadota bacterium]|nr:SPOR domain-containing protein [Pseudomonadota bacterium]
MSESVKPRFAIDLTEIERQLAQAGNPQAQPASAARNDPLAELARIVGQDDPFQSILANDGSSRPRQQSSSIDDIFAVRDTMTPTSREALARAPQGGHLAQDYSPAAYPQADEPAYGHQTSAAPQGQDAYGNEAYAQDYYDDQNGQYADQGYAQQERGDYAPVEKGRSRKGMMAIAAVLGAVVIGGGAYMVSGSAAVTGGEPPLIKANNEPTKVQPQNPGGVEIPNQNKQIYERAAQSTDTKVVNREEQPVDVQQTVRMSGSAVADATGGTVPGGAVKHQQTASLNLGEPRKVRTVTIRPDGTVAGSETAAPQAAAPVPAMTMPAQAQPAPVQVASAQPKPAASTPVAAPATPAAAPKAVPAAATPTSASSPQRVASVQPAAVAPTAAAETTPTGGFSVQLGLANSETAAQTAFASYQRKYPDLGGMPSLIRKAEVNGSTVYRVRVGPLSKDEASSLCSKLQGQGGQCFVAKN